MQNMNSNLCGLCLHICIGSIRASTCLSANLQNCIPFCNFAHLHLWNLHNREYLQIIINLCAILHIRMQMQKNICIQICKFAFWVSCKFIWSDELIKLTIENLKYTHPELKNGREFKNYVRRICEADLCLSAVGKLCFGMVNIKILEYRSKIYGLG